MQLFGKCVPNGEEAVFMFISYCVQSVILLIITLLELFVEFFVHSLKSIFLVKVLFFFGADIRMMKAGKFLLLLLCFHSNESILFHLFLVKN